MYENSPSPIANLPCLNRFAFIVLGPLTLAWIVYAAVTPPDPSIGAFGPLLHRLVSLGIVGAWIFILATSGLFWIIALLTGRRE